ncbi:hypothetical protein AN958_11039 [Leucoagaricus sp. SymC.cos]|nr:hypothetical protein AN958_11039 [Leucoagaricus sp. SymC.cos]
MDTSLIRQINAGNALVSGFSDLLTASTRVSRSMVVRNGASLKSVFQKAEKGNSPGKGLSWSFGRLFSSDKLRKRSPDSGVVSGNNGPHSISSATGAPTKGALHAFEIHSIILLSSPFLNWSIQTLNSNNITDLAFGTIEFRDVNWSSFLSQINTPALKSIGFRGYTPFNDLVTFMGRHQNITVLSVNNINFDDWCRVSNSMDSPSSLLDKLLNAFSNVQRLSCCPQGLVSLLSGVLHPSNPNVNIFPRLRVISILWSLGIGQQFRMAIVGDILAPIAHKLKDFQRAVFAIMYRADAGSTWRACPPPVLEKSPGGILYRPVAHTNASTTPEASNNNSPAAVSVPPTSTPSTATSVFSTFTEIKLEVTSRADREGVPALMKTLADTFTNVKHFRVDTRARAGRPAQENRLMKLYLCHHILKQFKQLKAVHIDGVRSKVAEREG